MCVCIKYPWKVFSSQWAHRQPLHFSVWRCSDKLGKKGKCLPVLHGREVLSCCTLLVCNAPSGNRTVGAGGWSWRTDRVISLLLDFSNRFAKVASSNYGALLDCGRKELLAGRIQMHKLSPLGIGASLRAIQIKERRC